MNNDIISASEANKLIDINFEKAYNERKKYVNRKITTATELLRNDTLITYPDYEAEVYLKICKDLDDLGYNVHTPEYAHNRWYLRIFW